MFGIKKISGKKVLAELKKNEETKDIPVLITTVKSENNSITRCVELGALGYFIKAHYTLDEIVSQIDQVLNKKKE